MSGHRLRRWPNIKPTLGNILCLQGGAGGTGCWHNAGTMLAQCLANMRAFHTIVCSVQLLILHQTSSGVFFQSILVLQSQQAKLFKMQKIGK